MLRVLLSVLLTSMIAIAANAADVRVSVSEVKDTRSTGNFSSFEITLKLVGDDVADIKGIRALVDTAVDDTGRNLLKEDQKKLEFETVREGSGTPEINLKLKNPGRRATVIRTLTGELQLFMPGQDPSATVTIKDFMNKTKKPLTDPTLKKSGIQLTVLTKKEYEVLKKEMEAKAANEPEMQGLEKAMVEGLKALFSGFLQVGDNDVILKVSDPQSKLIDMEVVDGKGKKIQSYGSMTSEEVRVLNFNKPIPPGAQLRVFVSTVKSVTSVPLKLADIPLP